MNVGCKNPLGSSMGQQREGRHEMRVASASLFGVLLVLMFVAGVRAHSSSPGPDSALDRRTGSSATTPRLWRIETVDGPGTGEYSSIALDSAGWPHISYFDFLNGDLEYAHKDAAGWTIETVDDAGTVGAFTSLALDSADHPHISYCSCTDQACTTCNDLKHAWYDGIEWHIEWVDTEGEVGGYTSLALNEVLVRFFSSGEWARWNTYQGIKVLAGDFDGDGDSDVVKFDVPASGTAEYGLWVGLSDPANSQFVTSEWARWNTSQEMKVLTGDFDGDGDTDVMKIDVPESGTAQGGLWVGLSDPANNRFVTTEWARWNTYQWMQVLAGDFDGDGDTDVMKIDVPESGTAQGGLWVGLSDPANSQFVTSEWAQWNTYPGMKVLAGDFDGDGDTDVMKIDVPESGTAEYGLWVGLSDPANNQFVTSEWARWNTSQEMKVLAGDFDGDGDTDVIKIDVPESGTAEYGLWVGLSDPANSQFVTSEWARWNTSQEMKVLAGDFDGDGDIDVMKIDVPESGTAQGGLWVGLSDPANNQFVTSEWARWNTYQWMKVLAGDFDGDGGTDVIKFDVPESGTAQSGLWVGLAAQKNVVSPHISYYDFTSGDLQYAYKDSSGHPYWETIDGAGADVGLFTSLALGWDHRHISYVDTTEDHLKYAHHDGSTWNVVPLDSTGHRVAWTSLALCTTSEPGAPRIGYRSDDSLMYAHKWLYGGWTIVALNDHAPVGISTALDSTCVARFSYFNGANGDLEYTYQDFNGHWQIEIVDDVGDVGPWWSSLTLDSSGQPHISYYNNVVGLGYAYKVFGVYLPLVTR